MLLEVIVLSGKISPESSFPLIEIGWPFLGKSSFQQDLAALSRE